jgi:hypothetical protein
MKQLVRCQVTGKLFPISLCYQSEVEKESKDLTGNIKVEKVKGYISAYANQRLGFKTNQAKFDKASKIMDSYKE